MNIQNNNKLQELFQQIKEKTDAIQNDLIAIRHDLHAHPEIRFKEFRTSKVAERNLKIAGIEVQSGVAGTGVVGILRGEKDDGKVIGIRADMDAIPIEEKSDVSYRSQIDGMMHACGHDVHTTILIGAAQILAEMRNSFKGTVKFIFQPSEEIPHGGKSGAIEMIKAGVLENPHVDAIMALHCWPELEAGQVGVASGPAMAGALAFQVKLTGQQAHAAKPHMGKDAILGAAEITSSIHHIISRHTDPADQFAINIGYIHGGSKLGIIAGHSHIEGTIRALTNESIELAKKKIKNAVEGISMFLDLENEVIWDKNCYSSTINDEHMNRIVSDAASSILGPENVIVQNRCPMTAEDFSHFTSRLPGYYLKLGVANKEKGINHPLHSELFDVDERSIGVGVYVLAAAAIAYLED